MTRFKYLRYQSRSVGSHVKHRCNEVIVQWDRPQKSEGRIIENSLVSEVQIPLVLFLLPFTRFLHFKMGRLHRDLVGEEELLCSISEGLLQRRDISG